MIQRISCDTAAQCQELAEMQYALIERGVYLTTLIVVFVWVWYLSGILVEEYGDES